MEKKPLFVYNKLLHIIIIPFLIFSLILILLLINSLNNEESSLFLLLNLILIIGILLFFYKLKVQIISRKLVVSFGIGLIKKEIPLSDIDLNSFDYQKIPWYYGIGWRYDFKGNLLFNAAPGTALSFQRVNKEYKIMIVTNKGEALKKCIVNSLKE